MKNLSAFKKVTTKCGKQFNKDSLTVVAFTLPDFRNTSTSYVLYQTIYLEYILCINHYDAKKDYITVDCEIIPKDEALPSSPPQKTKKM
jgi:hypothetical protein